MPRRPSLTLPLYNDPDTSPFIGWDPIPVNYLGDEQRAYLTDPNIYRRLQQDILSGAMPYAQGIQIAKDLRQFKRALDGDRSRPGEYAGTARLPTAPMPFAPEEQFIPDRAPGTDLHRVLRTAVENARAGEMTQGLRLKLAESDRPSDSYQREHSPAPDATPSLRDSISAAYEAHTDPTPTQE